MGKIDSKKEDLVTLSIYKFLCGHSHCKHICRLCLRFASKKTNLEEKIEIQVPYYHIKFVSYNSMLEDLNVRLFILFVLFHCSIFSLFILLFCRYKRNRCCLISYVRTAKS